MSNAGYCTEPRPHDASIAAEAILRVTYSLPRKAALKALKRAANVTRADLEHYTRIKDEEAAAPNVVKLHASSEGARQAAARYERSLALAAGVQTVTDYLKGRGK